MSQIQQERVDQLKADLTKIAEEHGLAVMGVGGNDFAYTIGLSKQGLPDVVVFGLPVRAAHTILNTLYRDIIAMRTENNGFVLPKGGIRFETLANLPLWLKPVEITSENSVNFSLSRTLHVESFGLSLDSFKAAQLIWPDTKGKFPWEEGFETRFIKDQPKLWAD